MGFFFEADDVIEDSDKGLMQYKPVMPNEPLKTGWNTKFGVKITEDID